MAYSVELLLNGKIVVALSVNSKGNSIKLYVVKNPVIKYFRDTLFSVLGAVCMAKLKFLYVLDFSELRAYSLINLKSDSPSLKLENS